MRKKYIVGIAAITCVVSLIVLLGLPAWLAKSRKIPQVGVPTPPLSFSDAPPGVESATLRPLNRDSSANALLEIVFDADDSRVKETVPIHVEGKTIVLRDDGKQGDVKAGDRKLSAVIDFDFKRELTAQADAAARSLEKPVPRPYFHGREIIGIEDPAVNLARRRVWSANRDLESFFAEPVTLSLFDFLPTVDPASIDPARSLMITDPLVVRDPGRTRNPCIPNDGNPDGVWTFKYLVTEMVAGTGVDPADFVEQWLKLWKVPQEVLSGFSAEPRITIEDSILRSQIWPRIDGKLDLDKLPFRLSAIVNRIDLGDSAVYGGSSSAGELRFVFGVENKQTSGCDPFPFSVILEYGVPASTCDEVKGWAKQWVDLSLHPLGSAAYNAALEAITVQVTRAHIAPGKPNGSALNQLRTNEKTLSDGRGAPWELREFRLNAGTHLLVQDTVKQTPATSLNDNSVIAQFVNENAAAIKADQHLVPGQFPGTSPFLGASSLATEGAESTTHFRAPDILDNDARFHFSLNSCIACHSGETETGFLHVDPRQVPATLSRFLIGGTDSVSDSPDPFFVTDPVDATTPPRAFNDLERRRQKLAALAGNLCLTRILVPSRRLLDGQLKARPFKSLPTISDPRLDGINVPVRMTH